MHYVLNNCSIQYLYIGIDNQYFCIEHQLLETRHQKVLLEEGHEHQNMHEMLENNEILHKGKQRGSSEISAHARSITFLGLSK